MIQSVTFGHASNRVGGAVKITASDQKFVLNKTNEKAQGKSVVALVCLEPDFVVKQFHYHCTTIPVLKRLTYPDHSMVEMMQAACVQDVLTSVSLIMRNEVSLCFSQQTDDPHWLHRLLSR